MRLWGDVGDGTDLESGGLQGTDGGFTTGTRALHEYVDLLDAVFHRLAGSGFGGHASGVRRGLAGALETDIATGRPGDNRSGRVRNRDDGVIESGLDVRLPDRHRLAVPATRLARSLLVGCH